MIFRVFLVILLLFMAVSTVPTRASDKPNAPEIATGISKTSVATGVNFMAVTAHPDATQAAYDILAAGGTAADAGIAAQLVLGLVEPQSSGIGGGSFALYFDNASKNLFSLDGRETAPSVAGAHLFTKEDGTALGFYEAGNGGRAVGVPGTMRLLEKLHEWQGRVQWEDLFQPAIHLAQNGFRITERMNKMLGKEKNLFTVDTKTKLYFYPNADEPIPAGTIKNNLQYADTLKTLSFKGVNDFYHGKLAKNLVEKVRTNRPNPGLLSLEDMKDYEVIERMPLCRLYRDYRICSMGQPSSGALTLLMTLGMLENFDLKQSGANNPQSWHIIAEASRLAFADRNHYIADPDFVNTPNTAAFHRNGITKKQVPPMTV